MIGMIINYFVHDNTKISFLGIIIPIIILSLVDQAIKLMVIHKNLLYQLSMIGFL
jgi:hypothetical protein